MTRFSRFAAPMLLAAAAACSGGAETAGDTSAAADPATISGMDHAGHAMAGDTGHARGVIRGLSADGRTLTIEHGPIDGIGMAAMTMGFEIAGDVELADIAVGDDVAFMVSRGRDGSYRINGLCKPATGTDAGSTECLTPMMGH